MPKPVVMSMLQTIARFISLLIAASSEIAALILALLVVVALLAPVAFVDAVRFSN